MNESNHLFKLFLIFLILYLLGTVITEWDDGKARCESFLKDETSYKQFANRLVAIAQYYGFDGWLVNIENKIEVRVFLFYSIIYLYI